MADEVKIVDVAGGPAAEATLQEILKLMRSKGGSGGASAADKVQDLYTTAVTRGTTTQTTNSKALNESTKSINVFGGAISVLKGGFSIFGAALSGAAGIIGNFGSAVANASSVGEFLEAVPVFGSVLGKATGYFDKSLDTFRQLSETGAGFGNDMLAMRSAAAQAGLTLDQFASMVGSNSQRMTLLGGTTSDGAVKFGKLSKALRSADAGLMALGYTQEGVNEGLGAYLEQQALAGQVRGRSDASLISGAQSYLTELDKLAKVTGKSRKELSDEMNARMQAANINVAAAKLSGQALQNYQNNLQFASDIMGKSGPAFSAALSDMADGVSQTPLAKMLEKNVGGLKELNMQNQSGAISQEEYQTRLMALIPKIAGFTDSLSEAQISAMMNTEGMGELLDMTADSRVAGQKKLDMDKAAAEQAKKAPMTKFFADFGQTIQNVRSSVEGALLDSGVFGTLGTLLTSTSSILMETVQGITKHVISYLKSPEFGETVTRFQTYIKEAGEKAKTFVSYLKTDEFKEKLDKFMTAIGDAWRSISGFVKDIGEVGFSQAIAKMFGGTSGQTLGDVIISKITDGLGDLWSNAGLITKIGAGLLALFTGAKIVGALKSGVGSLFGGMFGGGDKGGGSKGGDGGAKAGKGVGAFVGNVGGGVLSGIAKGLSAFASPQVAIGGAALAAVILAIGAAVAGATWLMGKALPTMAEGMKSFEDLDGAALKAAGDGMIAISLGMAAFGAGAAVAGLGSLVGGITEGVGKLFGAEDPMEKLQRFASYNIDAARVEGNANALVAFSTAMAAQGAGAAASGLGSMVGAIGDGVASFLGGKTGIPYDKITQFQSYSFDAEKIRANAAAMVAFNNALSSSAGAQASSGAGGAISAIGNAISSFFGGQTPFEQVKSFGELNINAEGVKNNALAMASMASALSSMSGGNFGDIEIPKSLVTRIQELSAIQGGGLTPIAQGMTAIANVQGLQTNLDILKNGLDTQGITSYNTAMVKLVDTLTKLNEVLAEDNKGMFGGGTGVSAASVVQSGAAGSSNSSTGSSEQLDRLNMLVTQLVSLTEESNRYSKGTLRAASGNLQMGI